MERGPDRAGRPAADDGTRCRSGVPSTRDILLLGNLQVGKTNLFQRLCRSRTAEIGIPQTSDRMTRGELRLWLGTRVLGVLGEGGPLRVEPCGVLDAPGTATLFAQGEDEMVAAEALLLLRPGRIVLVADAKNLRRSLALFLHAAQFGVPMVVALNMVDEARLMGVEVDADALEKELGVPVVKTNARDGVGLRELVRRLSDAAVPTPARLPAAVEAAVAELQELLVALPAHRRGVALSLLAGDRTAQALVLRELGRAMHGRCQQVVERVGRELPRPVDVLVTDLFYAEAEAICPRVVRTRRVRGSWFERAGQWAQHPVFGLGIAALVLLALYYFVGVLGATLVVDLVNQKLFGGFLIPLCERALGWIPSTLVYDALMDPDFGLLPTGLFLAIGVVFPVLLFFYVAFGVLQDSGYLARLSVLLDRHLRRVGLNGRGLVPLAMGFSCVTMALITTRMLQSRRERVIASFLLILAVPCAPLLGVMLVVLGDMPLSATIVTFGIIALQVLLAGNLAARILPGRGGDFILELPPMRMPRWRHVFWITWRQTFLFMKEAVPYFLLATFVLFVFDRMGGLDVVKAAVEPSMNWLLGLPEDAVQVFIKTMIRRENGAAELERLRGEFTNLQSVVTLLVMTFVTPCVNSALVLYKEQGAKAATVILAIVPAWALAVGAALYHGCRLLGVTFGG